jgi:hypothetical protein
MDRLKLGQLRAMAVALVGEREKLDDLGVVHVAADQVPSIRARLFKFFLARRDAPNDPKYEIVLDERGKQVNPDVVALREGVTLFPRPVLAVDRRRLPQVAAADGPITIAPAENDLVLSPDATFEEVITVHIPKSSVAAKVDVYFLADTTGSMGPILSAIQGSADAILTGLAATAGLDVAFGVGNYKDFPNGGASPFQHQVSPTADLAAARAGINAWAASGGRDIPEGQLFALDQLAEDVGGAIGWRFDARPIVVWFGDAPGHDNVCQAMSGLDHDITEGHVLGNLARAGITLIAISTTTGPGLDADPTAGAGDYVLACGEPGGTAGQATRLTDATLGTLLTDIEPTAIVAAILESVADAIATIGDVRLDPVGEAGAFVEAIAPRRAGPLDATVDQAVPFRVRFRGTRACGMEPQVFEGQIAAVVDGDVKTFKRLQVTVPRCPRITEIDGDPGVAVALRDIGPQSTGQISAFARGPDRQLLRCFNDGDPTDVSRWIWEDWGRPASARVTEVPFGVASFQESVNSVNEYVHAFVKGDDGSLYERHSVGGVQSSWIDHSHGNWTIVASPTVQTFRRTFVEESDWWEPFEEDTIWYDSVDQLAAFVWGSDGMVHRHHQTWHGHGRPPSGADLGGPAGVGHRPFHFLYVYVVGNDRRLYATHSTNHEATSWGWVDLGQPAPNTGALWFRRPGVVSFLHDGSRRLYTFLPAEDSHLWVHVWRGREPRLRNPDAGAWHDLGAPNGVAINGAASVVTCPHNGPEQMYAFVRGSDRRLYVRFWDAANSVWVWRDLGQPATATVRSDPSAVVCRYPGADPLYAFVRGSDDHLYMCHMDSGVMNVQWKDLSVQP